VTPFVIVALMTVVAHFLPFERAALAPDDYLYQLKLRDAGLRQVIHGALVKPDRPLQELVIFVQEALVGDRVVVGLLLLVLSSLALVAAAYWLFLELFGDTFPALLGALIYLLLPNKLELYHTAIYVSINVPMALYVVSLASFVRFARASSRPMLILSLLAYAVAVFWYEVGVLLPVVLLAYVALCARAKLGAVAWFAVPVAVYALYRGTAAFGLYAGPPVSGLSSMSVATAVQQVLLHVPGHYVGWYAGRAVLYGFWNFWAMAPPWPAVLLALDLGVLGAALAWLRVRPAPPSGPRLLAVAGIMFVLFLVPNVFVLVAGRHTALPSLGFTVACVALVGRLGRHWRAVAAGFGLALLIVSQGNAWIQVVACRITRAVHEDIGRRRAEILRAERVVVDARSFAERIPYTWGVSRGGLYTYYGMQALAPWGLSAMAPLVVGAEKPVYVTRSRPVRSGDELTFQVEDSPVHPIMSVPAAGTALVDYESVYGDGFRYGRRAKGPAIGPAGVRA
jgi:hypothetical protein